MTRAPWLCAATLWLALGCAAALPYEYEKSRAAAERAYASGRYDEAAEQWLAASKAAERNKERNEAQYRAAASYRRAGRWAEAKRLDDDLVQKHPCAWRASRAAYDAAITEIEHGDARHGWTALERALYAYPGSGNAAAAVERMILHAEDQGGVVATRALLDRLIVKLDATEISEFLHFAYARELEHSGLLSAARDRYLYVAARFPYPQGHYWDDSLWQCSVLDEQLGQPKAAIEHLRRMLREREPSHLSGSYERPRYSPAQFRIAELYRDRLHDDASARREFHRVYTDHPTSILVDDALWNEAVLASRAGDASAACSALGELVLAHDDSRFVPCAPRLCPKMSAPKDRECREYITRSLSEAKATDGDP